MNNKNNNIMPVGAINHEDEHRASIPTTELAGEESLVVENMSPEGQYKQFKHEFDRGRDPELYWLGKYKNDNDETQSSDLKVDTRSLYRHEEIRPEMLINQLYTLKADENAAGMASLFGNEMPKTVYEDELQRITEYYQHNADWRNRLIQGDSLLVMNSLLQREGMAGRVQMVYIDPPYGIKYGSNWQMKLNNRDMKDNDESLTGEPEMIKAFRDTWELGIHSYLSYLRDRLVLARELLTESGSCFVQISDDNVHLVRNLMDEVFGSENFVSQIVYVKTTGAGSPSELLAPPAVSDYILWYARSKANMKFRKLSLPKSLDGETINSYKNIELKDGTRMSISEWEKLNKQKLDYTHLPEKSRLFKMSVLYSSSGNENSRFPIVFEGKTYKLKTGSWKTGLKGMERLIKNKRIMSSGSTLNYVRYFDDYLRIAMTNLWPYTSVGANKLYVVQSSITPIQRCVLMSTDPGDLVLDPTCGSGTTAYVAEQWGRRWITIDTSRIAINIAKRRLSTAIFPFYELFDKEDSNIRQGFVYNTVSHLKLQHIANDMPADEEPLYDSPKVNKKKSV